MRIHQFLYGYALTIGCLLAASTRADAVEYAFSTYALGESAFSAGVTPPPGIYVSTVIGTYNGQLSGTASFGGVTINAGTKADAYSTAMSFLYVPDRKLLGGNLGVSITVPSAWVDYRAGVEVQAQGFSREVSGWGMGDVIPRVQLGWQRGDFAHTVYLEVITATGFWEPRFMPIVSMHRPGIDTGWAFTWTDKQTKLQVSGTAGFTFNFENPQTNYQSGNEFHWEWAVGIECIQGLVIGVVGYDYRQLNGDSGSGDTVGPFRGSLDAIGAGLSYTTIIDKRPVTYNLRYYHDYDFDKHFHGDTTTASATIRF
jgi:hypothetical protein